MGKAYQVVGISVMEMVQIRNTPGIRLTTSPLGVSPHDYAVNPPKYAGRSAPWKGMKNPRPGMGVPAALRSAYKAVADGLEAAIKMSKQFAGTYGTGIGADGKVYTNKNIAQSRAATSKRRKRRI